MNPHRKIQTQNPGVGLLHRIILGVLIALFCLGTVPLSAQHTENIDTLPPREITEGWEYRWGDSPVDEDGVPIWIYLDSPEWKAAPNTALLPVEGKGHILWLRVPLPDEERKEPTRSKNHVLQPRDSWIIRQVLSLRVENTPGVPKS